MVTGALCRWEKEILALGPNMLPGRGPTWCFLQGGGGVCLFAWGLTALSAQIVP